MRKSDLRNSCYYHLVEKIGRVLANTMALLRTNWILSLIMA
jgi:hypothetical protein